MQNKQKRECIVQFTIYVRNLHIHTHTNTHSLTSTTVHTVSENEKVDARL